MLACCFRVSLARISATSIALVLHWLLFYLRRALPCSVALVLRGRLHTFPIRFCYFCSACLMSFFHRRRSLWCFTGYYFIDDERSHAAWRSSCAPVYTLLRRDLLTFKLALLMWMAVLALLLWCFTGYHFTHFWCSGVSLATISLTTSVPMLRGARRPRS